MLHSSVTPIFRAREDQSDGCNDQGHTNSSKQEWAWVWKLDLQQWLLVMTEGTPSQTASLQWEYCWSHHPYLGSPQLQNGLCDG